MHTTLILTPRYTEDSQALWREAGQLGWRVERLINWRIPDDLRDAIEPVLFLEPLIAPMVAEALGLRLLEPAVDWLPRLPEEYRKRHIALTTLHEAQRIDTLKFMKPPNDKSFPAAVYVGNELPQGYADDSPILVAEIVSWEVEYRCFILDRRLQTMSVYLREGVLQRENGFTSPLEETAEAEAFIRKVLVDERVELPRTAVLDIGIVKDRGWAIIEQNAAWGAGLYGCDPQRVLETIRFAVEKL